MTHRQWHSHFVPLPGRKGRWNERCSRQPKNQAPDGGSLARRLRAAVPRARARKKVAELRTLPRRPRPLLAFVVEEQQLLIAGDRAAADDEFSCSRRSGPDLVGCLTRSGCVWPLPSTVRLLCPVLCPNLARSLSKTVPAPSLLQRAPLDSWLVSRRKVPVAMRRPLGTTCGLPA